MSSQAINIEGLWKSYQLGRSNPTSFREVLTKFGSRKKREYFWALQDINLKVEKGEAIGIIGGNGAGKSTLLKVLSKITYPTRGKIELEGRVSSLLEVGTGFHPELTGRQNVFLNGTILGMTRAEIKNKFDEIVSFSGVEKFLDTAVKHYSSGMKVRLAFSVAAHLEPEILIIDEVLAVGDAEFQKKCLGKMEDVTEQGRTVLFVSHNLAAVSNLCNSGFQLDKGQITFSGKIEDVISNYASVAPTELSKNFESEVDRKGEGTVFFSGVDLKSSKLNVGDDILFECKIKSLNSEFKSNNIDFAVGISNRFDSRLIHCSNRFVNKKIEFVGSDKSLKVRIENPLSPGVYKITLFLRIDGIVQDWITNAVSFEVLSGNPYGFSNTTEIQGAIMPAFSIDDY